MTIVGFNITKISGERKNVAGGKINISNNVSIKNVSPTDLSLGPVKNQDGLKVDFLFQTTYEPGMGSIILEGNVLYMGDEQKVKEIMETWKKTKKLPKDIMVFILNTVLQRCNIEALILSKELNLPPPVQMPRITQKETPTQMPEQTKTEDKKIPKKK